MPRTIAAITAMSIRWPEARAIYIESKAAGPAVISMLQSEIPGILPWPREGERQESKLTYAMMIQPDHQAHSGPPWICTTVLIGVPAT